MTIHSTTAAGASLHWYMSQVLPSHVLQRVLYRAQARSTPPSLARQALMSCPNSVDSFVKLPKSHLTRKTSQCRWGFGTQPSFWQCPAPPHLHGRVRASPTAHRMSDLQRPFPWYKPQLWKCRRWGQLARGTAWQGAVCPPAPGTGWDGALGDTRFSR